MNQPLLHKPSSQQEPEPLQHVFRAVKSTCQTVGGKIKIQKIPECFKAAEGRRRELSFPAGIHTQGCQLQNSLQGVSKLSRTSCFVCTQKPPGLEKQ